MILEARKSNKLFLHSYDSDLAGHSDLAVQALWNMNTICGGILVIYGSSLLEGSIKLSSIICILIGCPSYYMLLADIQAIG